MTPVNDLIAFIRARLAEDEQIALGASPGPWHPDEEHDEVLAVDDVTVAEGFALSGRQLRATVEHIARHDPARVLREIEGKRRLLNGLVPLMAGPALLRPLALVYADHPDYRPEWAYQ